MSDSVSSKSTRLGTAVEKVKPSMPVLDAYVIRREIGKGGMAVVYEAVEKSLNRVVALKVLNNEFAQDNDLIKRFVNEAQAAARLSHPNIVQIYSIGQEKGVYYFAMENVRGESVESILAKNMKIPVSKGLDIIKQTVLALREAGRNNIIHRDIKPGNLLITEQGLVKVADFGLAAEIKELMMEKGGRIIGTPLYMSPEQAQGKEADFRSDIYSLGITFYQMLSGSPPFLSTDTKILIKKHIEEDLPKLSREIPFPVRRLISKMTNKEADKRFFDYESLLKEIDRIQKRLTRKKFYRLWIITALIPAAAVISIGILYKPLPPKVEKEKLVRKRYEEAVRRAEQYPEQYKETIRELVKIINEFPNSEYALRSEEVIDKIIQAAVKGYSEELKQVEDVQDDFIDKKQYQKLIDRYMAVKKRYKDTEGETVAEEKINSIIQIARRDYGLMEEKAKVYLNHHKYASARNLYETAADNFGISEYVRNAEDKIKAINDMEKVYEADMIFSRKAEETKKYLDECRFEEARQVMVSVEEKSKINPVLNELVRGELDKIDKTQLEYESKKFKEKIDLHQKMYFDIVRKTEKDTAVYAYKEALDAIDGGLKNIDTTEWKKGLLSIKQELQYLDMLKGSIINGINKELKDKNINNISANEDTLVFSVEDGYMAVPWMDASAERIYEIAQKYIEKNADGYIALGVFCLSDKKLLDNARRELTKALRMDPSKQEIVEKYFIRLAEIERKYI